MPHILALDIIRCSHFYQFVRWCITGVCVCVCKGVCTSSSLRIPRWMLQLFSPLVTIDQLCWTPPKAVIGGARGLRTKWTVRERIPRWMEENMEPRIRDLPESKHSRTRGVSGSQRQRFSFCKGGGSWNSERALGCVCGVACARMCLSMVYVNKTLETTERPSWLAKCWQRCTVGCCQKLETVKLLHRCWHPKMRMIFFFTWKEWVAE